MERKFISTVAIALYLKSCVLVASAITLFIEIEASIAAKRAVPRHIATTSVPTVRSGTRIAILHTLCYLPTDIRHTGASF